MTIQDQLRELLEGMRPFPEMEHEQWVIEHAALRIDALEAAVDEARHHLNSDEDWQVRCIRAASRLDKAKESSS